MMSSLSLDGGVNITLVQGSIIDQKVDVIVNSTELNLDLANAAVLSKIILKGAGPSLQEECNTKYPDGFQEGNVAVTGAHNLSNKAIYHVHCPPFEPIGLQRLTENVTSCLSQADLDGYKSIAFPALGCGGRSYPTDRATHTIISSMVNYFKGNTSNLKDVSIILCDADNHIMQAFEKVIEKCKVSMPARIPSLLKANVIRRLEVLLGSGNVPSVGRTEEKRTLSAKTPHRVHLSVKKKSILDLKVDVIVNSTKTNLDLANAGTLSKAILVAAGQSLQDECKQKYPDGYRVDEVAVTGGHNLTCQNIYHICLLDWDGGKGDSAKHLVNMIERCCAKAISDGKRHIAFPVLASKGLGYPIDVVVNSMISTLKTVKKGKTGTTLTDIFVVIHPNDVELIKAFDSSALHAASPRVVPKPTLLGLHDLPTTAPPDAVSKPHRSDKVTQMTLMGGSTVALVTGSIANCQMDVVVNTTSLSLKPEDASHACKAIFQKAGPKLKAECAQQFPNGIKEDDCAVTGGHDMACKVIYHIYCPPWDAGNSLKKLDNTISICLQKASIDGHNSITFPAIGTGGRGYPKQAVAETMLKSVQVFYEKENRRNPSTVQILLFDKDVDGIKAFTEVFEKQMKDGLNLGPVSTAPLLRPKSTRAVARPETLAIETRIKLPKTWSKSSNDFEFNEVPKGSPEFKGVEDNFLSSRPEDCTAAKSIFRLQNKSLFQKYALHKMSIDERCGGTDTERMLWHGTSLDAIPKINKGGFNRSYCGKNATHFGKGVYFALNSNYSAQRLYSVPDADGIRYMYYARVLVGRFALGKKDLNVPPPLDDDPNVTHDSLVNDPNNPEIFVIFHDDQAYPEYLIYF